MTFERSLYIGTSEKRYPDGIKIADVARWNEFGTETIPPRPAFSMGVTRAVKNHEKFVKAQLENFVAACFVKDKQVSKAHKEKLEMVLLTQLGRVAVFEIKKIILQSETIPNAPATVAKKGFNHPWYNTHLLSRNIEYLVTK